MSGLESLAVPIVTNLAALVYAAAKGQDPLQPSVNGQKVKQDRATYTRDGGGLHFDNCIAAEAEHDKKGRLGDIGMKPGGDGLSTYDGEQVSARVSLASMGIRKRDLLNPFYKSKSKEATPSDSAGSSHRKLGEVSPPSYNEGLSEEQHLPPDVSRRVR